MRRQTRNVVLFVLALAAVGLVFAWPRINDVETGKTRQYPTLQPRSYDVAPDHVYAVMREIATTTPGWKITGHGFGPGSFSVQAVRTLRPLPLKYDVHVKISRQGPEARVSVRSTSRWGKWDFGQNARNIRALLRMLDARLAK